MKTPSKAQVWLLAAAWLLSSCSIVESVARSTKRVAGIPEASSAGSLSARSRADAAAHSESGAAADAIPASEYAAACLRERRRLILEILDLKEVAP